MKFFLYFFFIEIIRLLSINSKRRKITIKSNTTQNFDKKHIKIYNLLDAQLNFVQTLLKDLATVWTFLLSKKRVK